MTDKAQGELSDCPFCGGAAKQSRKSLDERFGYADEVTIQCVECGVTKFARGRTSNPGYADNSTVEERAVRSWNRRAALKAQPAPTDPYYLSDDADAAILNDAKVAIVRLDYYAKLHNTFTAKPAPAEAQGGKLMELFKHTLGTLAVHDHAEAERIGKLWRGEVPNLGNLAVQGEDSARLADGYKSSTMVSDFYGPKITLHYETTAQADAVHDLLVAMIERASAETGGVKS